MIDLSTLLMDLFQNYVLCSVRYFPNGNLPPSGNFLNMQFPKCILRRLISQDTWRCAQDRLGKLHIWELSCHLGKFPWENVAWESTFGKLSLGKIHLGSCCLGKHTWEVVTWENTLEKLLLGKMPLEVVTWENTFGKFLLGKYLCKVFIWENTLGALGTCKYLG